ncbi:MULTISPECIES: PAS domain-containing methyl-accepting chemotaxis protein [Pseudomonas]|uniref:methyl-accepting chemotaxis protein n=1 Tax=Pseudomonas marincola TaxID=437900 RepID=UPI0030034657
MRNNQPVTQRERTFSADQRLISTTDTKGQITYCNDEFVKISGFSMDELIRAPHNLVRHPDVPPAVFQHMWSTLQQGRPWMGIVKNRCKNGDHYWVNAYVTPILSNSQVIGFESVRVKPTAEQISRAEQLYARVNSGKPAVASSDSWLPRTLDLLPYIGIGLFGCVAAQLIESNWALLAIVAASIPLGLMALSWQQRGLQRLLKLSEETISDPMIAQMYTSSKGAVARLEMSALSQEARLKTCLTRLLDSAENLAEQASQADTLAINSSSGLERQRQETEQVATAVNEMAATTLEVASNVARTAIATQEANRLTREGRTITAQTREAIERLSVSVGETGETVTRLAQDSNEIGSVVDVIKGIADQTNLLALNAAIEAARAGEMGRGFAVVADEVRSLAQRTGESTGQIHQLIAKLQRTAEEAVVAMQIGRSQADEGVKQVLLADQALMGISDSVENIAGMADQIAAAAEEQSAVADEINRNITNIAQLSDQTAEDAQQTARLSQALTGNAKGQQSLVERFNR